MAHLIGSVWCPKVGFQCFQCVVKLLGLKPGSSIAPLLCQFLVEVARVLRRVRQRAHVRHKYGVAHFTVLQGSIAFRFALEFALWSCFGVCWVARKTSTSQYTVNCGSVQVVDFPLLVAGSIQLRCKFKFLLWKDVCIPLELYGWNRPRQERGTRPLARNRMRNRTEN